MLRKLKNSTIRNISLSSGVLILLLIVTFVIRNSNSMGNNYQVIINNNAQSAQNINPLSSLTTAQIAVQVANMTGIYETISVTNQADSQTVSENVTPEDNQLIAEPLILATSIKTRADIVKYTVENGDTLASLANKFGVTSTSISESNNLTGSVLKVGAIIYIPPINGLVYVVKSGDTANSLANRYNASASAIISFNDAEISGLKVGERIVVPNGSITQVVSSYSISDYYKYDGYAFGASPIYGYNGYDFGFCTWYVAERRAEAGDPLPANLGNAITWYALAQRAGLPTGLTPQVGAVIWFGLTADSDHVGYVEAINPDGSLLISEMNSYGYLDANLTHPGGGWGVRDYRAIPANQVQYYRFIY